MGIAVGLANAVVTSFQNSFYKRISGSSPSVVNWFRFTTALPVLAVLVVVFSRWHLPSYPFWWVLLGLIVPSELAQSYFYVTAFQRSPQSIIGPLFSLTALYLLPLGYLFLGEVPSLIGFAGVISVVAGFFFLGWQERNARLATALRNVMREPGAWRMVVATFCSAVTVTAVKFVYHYAAPLLTAFYVQAGVALALSAFLLIRHTSPLRAAEGNVAGAALSYAVDIALTYVGLSLLLVAYYISVKRFSIVFDVIFGRFMHREDHFGKRMIGAALMVAGVVLVALG